MKLDMALDMVAVICDTVKSNIWYIQNGKNLTVDEKAKRFEKIKSLISNAQTMLKEGDD